MTSTPTVQTSEPLRLSDHEILIDLSDLAFASSADLSMLVKTLQRVEKTGVKIALTGLQENLRRIFEIKQLDRMFPMTAAH
jgi:anti-sigma B factor antagonist